MEMQRVSACTYPLREREVEYAFEVIAAAGIGKVDLFGRLPHFSANADECDPVALKEKAARFGLRIANLGTYPGAAFASDSEAEREAAMAEMITTIDRAAFLGSRSIRVRPGDRDDPALVDRLVAPFQRSAAYAASKGVFLGMENHRGSIAGHPDVCADLCERVGSPYFGVLYDPCNVLDSGVDYKEAFKAFGRYVVHLHLKDGAFTDGKFARRHLGEGAVDIGWVLEALAGVGYAGDYALEYEITDIEPVETGLARWVETFRKF